MNNDKLKIGTCRKHGTTPHYKSSRSCTLCAGDHSKARYQKMKAALAAVGNVPTPQPIDTGDDLI